MDRCSSFLLFLHSSVHSLTHVDLVLPGVEVLCLIFPFWVPWSVFRVSMGNILSALLDIKMYRTPIQTVSYDTIKYRMPSCEVSYDTGRVSHAFLRNVAWHFSSIARLKEKCRPSLLRSVTHFFGKNLRERTVGTFHCVPNFLRMALDTLLGILQPCVVAFEFWWFLLESSFCVSVLFFRV